MYFAKIESSVDFFCPTLNDWLCVTEANLKDNLLTFDDSAFQTGIGLLNKPGPLSVSLGQAGSLKTSSISAARAKDVAEISELRALLTKPGLYH